MDRASGKCSENLKTSFPDGIMLPNRNNTGSATLNGCVPAREAGGGDKAGYTGLVWVCLLVLCSLQLLFKLRVSVLHLFSTFCMWFLCCQHFPTLITSGDSNSFNIMMHVADLAGSKYLANLLFWPGWRVIYNGRAELASQLHCANSFIIIVLLHYFEILLLLIVCQSQIFLLNENP